VPLLPEEHDASIGSTISRARTRESTVFFIFFFLSIIQVFYFKTIIS